MSVHDESLVKERPSRPSETDSARISTPSPDSETVDDILDELRALRRERQHRDFSLWQLAAAVAQAFALGAVAWGVYAAIDGNHDDATIRLLAGIAFQLMALTGFAAPRNS